MSPRKPNGRAVSAYSTRPLPLPAVRQQIWAAAHEMRGSDRLASTTLARRFSLEPVVIEEVLLAEGARHERVAAALRNGITNALQIAREVASGESCAA